MMLTPGVCSARRVMETRRGRCGEYSRLFFKAMEALNYKARWVVDWEVRRYQHTCMIAVMKLGRGAVTGAWLLLSLIILVPSTVPS